MEKAERYYYSSVEELGHDNEDLTFKVVFHA